MCKTDLSGSKEHAGQDFLSLISATTLRSGIRVGAREYEAVVIRESGPSCRISEPPVLSVSRLTRLNTA
jgi:hypothetical protein